MNTIGAIPRINTKYYVCWILKIKSIYFKSNLFIFTQKIESCRRSICESRLEREIKHARFILVHLFSRATSNLSWKQPRKNSFITLKCTTYTIKIRSFTLQETQLCCYLQPCTMQFKIHNIHNPTRYNPL